MINLRKALSLFDNDEVSAHLGEVLYVIEISGRRDVRELVRVVFWLVEARNLFLELHALQVPVQSTGQA